MKQNKSFVTRDEIPGDAPFIRKVHLAAFPGPAEADLVDTLRNDGHLSLSQVALCETKVVGHIAFSPVVLGDPGYYSRFGFRKASAFGLGNEYGANEEFMFLWVGTRPAPVFDHVVRYSQAFRAFST